jgi:hypothetical protein
MVKLFLPADQRKKAPAKDQKDHKGTSDFFEGTIGNYTPKTRKVLGGRREKYPAGGAFVQPDLTRQRLNRWKFLFVAQFFYKTQTKTAPDQIPGEIQKMNFHRTPRGPFSKGGSDPHVQQSLSIHPRGKDHLDREHARRQDFLLAHVQIGRGKPPPPADPPPANDGSVQRIVVAQKPLGFRDSAIRDKGPNAAGGDHAAPIPNRTHPMNHHPLRFRQSGQRVHGPFPPFAETKLNPTTISAAFQRFLIHCWKN